MSGSKYLLIQSSVANIYVTYLHTSYISGISDLFHYFVHTCRVELMINIIGTKNRKIFLADIADENFVQIVEHNEDKPITALETHPVW